jgi:hypothetical protein
MKKVVLIALILFNFLPNQSYGKNLQKILKKRKNSTSHSETLYWLNLNGESLQNESLEYIDFIYCKCRKTNFSGASLSGARFINSDLTKANFSRATFSHTTDFKKAKSLEGANFYKASFLSNKQKKILRKNGAINVPEDLTPGEECGEACGPILALIIACGIGSSLLQLMANN